MVTLMHSILMPILWMRSSLLIELLNSSLSRRGLRG